MPSTRRSRLTFAWARTVSFRRLGTFVPRIKSWRPVNSQRSRAAQFVEGDRNGMLREIDLEGLRVERRVGLDVGEPQREIGVRASAGFHPHANRGGTAARVLGIRRRNRAARRGGDLPRRA